MSIGKNLQYLRKMYNKMTQEELAEKMQVSRQTISKWEQINVFHMHGYTAAWILPPDMVIEDS